MSAARQLAVIRKRRFLETVTGLEVLVVAAPQYSQVLFKTIGPALVDGNVRIPAITSRLYEDDPR